jgi:hypothetical protein
MESTYLIDEYVATQPGEPYRLFPFGTIIKNGHKRDITPEYAASFKLPHFKPPIKRGSHEDTTPAGGHIVGLEVRIDGLYAIPEMNEQGAKALQEGAYRYHSPEVIWDDGGLENPQTGEIIPGPFIVGDALLHTPHLGEAAALYSIDPIKEKTMTDETVEIPKNFWEKFTAFFEQREPEVKIVPPEDYEAVKTERESFKAELDTLKAEKARVETLAALKSELRGERFCSAFAADEVADEAAAMLAGMTDEQREWVKGKLAALAGQVEVSNLTEEKGSDQPAPESAQELMGIEIKKAMDERKLSYQDAFRAVCLENPELANKYAKGA